MKKLASYILSCVKPIKTFFTHFWTQSKENENFIFQQAHGISMKC